MMVDAVFGHDACHSDRGHPDSPSTCTHSPRTTSPVGVVQASLQESETPAGKSSDDATPGARNSSLTARMSPEPHRGQDLGDAGCRSGDPESETVDGAPDKARPSPQLPPPRRSRRRSPHAHTTAQEEDSGADTESSGSEDNPDVPEYARDEDYCPSPPEVQESGSQDDDVDDGEHQDHKRRKEEEKLGWAEIRQRFAQRFPERGGSSLQVHYCTKLKYRRT
ncbi:hypothetical protein CEP52_016706 [Fusarium oligoseptatum]|uniref:Myb-like domain-containing protein n=1 Tax=Fusarium oligoseptatum TaxID=2604345 RepID=A0A428S147_9HYPO|nr:hypothetical protein CEP52_016706 [Fusarium oligoseptatum]